MYVYKYNILKQGIQLKTLPFDRTMCNIQPLCLLSLLDDIKLRWIILTEHCCHFHTIYNNISSCLITFLNDIKIRWKIGSEHFCHLSVIFLQFIHPV
jgi:hypothetical protein